MQSCAKVEKGFVAGEKKRQVTQHFVGSQADVLLENDGELGEDVGRGRKERDSF